MSGVQDPPKTNIPPSRPIKGRIPSCLGKRFKQQQCKRCKQYGRQEKTCKAPLPGDTEDALNFGPSTNKNYYCIFFCLFLLLHQSTFQMNNKFHVFLLAGREQERLRSTKSRLSSYYKCFHLFQCYYYLVMLTIHLFECNYENTLF